MDNSERNRQHWVHKTQDEDKENKIQHRKLKTGATSFTYVVCTIDVNVIRIIKRTP